MTKRKLTRITKLSLFPASVLVVAWMAGPLIFWTLVGAMFLVAVSALFLDELLRG